jgi:hypothetical protein
VYQDIIFFGHAEEEGRTGKGIVIVKKAKAVPVLN